MNNILLKASCLFSILFILLSCTGNRKKNDPVSRSEYAGQKNQSTSSVFNTATFDSLWTVEAQDSEVLFYNDTLEVISREGFTLWWNEKLSGDISIEYHACVMDEGEPYDRVSDLNCFWMVTDPLYPDDIFARSAWRNGDFGKYYSLNLYYVGYGGNENTTTRFRKYAGDYDAFEKERIRPAVLMEYTDLAYLLEPNKWYHVKIVCRGENIQYFINDILLFDYPDSAPYTSGWFGFRTVQSRIKLYGFSFCK